MTEQEIANGCQQGSNLARKELYELFAGKMFALCLRYAGQREEAEDLLQDGFLQVFSVIDRFKWRGEGSLSAWVRRVFTNFALTYLEKQRRTQTEDIELLPDLPEEDTPPPEISTGEIMKLIEELPEGYRTVLNLFLVEGWSHREIAQKLHIGESTSASQYLRAKRLLKQKIILFLQSKEA